MRADIAQPVIAKAAVLKLSQQWPQDACSQLYLAVIAQAIYDLTDNYSDHSACRWFRNRKQTAQTFLEGPLDYADRCGINPAWVQRVLRKCNIL